MLHSWRPPRGWCNTVAIHNPETGTTIIVDDDNDYRGDGGNRESQVPATATVRIQGVLNILDTVRESRQMEPITIRSARQSISITRGTIATAMLTGAAGAVAILLGTPLHETLTPTNATLTCAAALLAETITTLVGKVAHGVLHQQLTISRLYRLAQNRYEGAEKGIQRTSADGRVNAYLATRVWIP